MTDEQKQKCHAIIHTHAIAAAAGNGVTPPGLGIAVDTAAMITMTMSLCAVFGGNISEEVAKAMAIHAIKQAMLQQPVKTGVKELSKFIPFLGQIVAPALTVTILEAAGWAIAGDLDAKYNKS